MSIEVEIKIEEKSLRKLRRKMKQVNDDLCSAYIPNRMIGGWLFRWVEQNFSSEGGKVGGWKRFKYGGRLVTKKQTSRDLVLPVSMADWLIRLQNCFRTLGRCTIHFGRKQRQPV